MNLTAWHVGTGGPGRIHRPGPDCLCPREACGLVDTGRINQVCPEHAPRHRRLLRGHLATKCPGRVATDVLPAGVKAA